MGEPAPRLVDCPDACGSVWRCASASRPGSSHLAMGIECQDSYRIAELANGVLVAVVADGAGSAPMAADGARIGSEVLAEALAAALADGPASGARWKEIATSAFMQVRDALN